MNPRLQSALDQLPDLLTAHLQLTLLAITLATAISVPLGVFAVRRERLKQPILAVAGVIQTIPALALLAVMVPTLSGLGLPGIGFLPALLGLTLYCLLPILWGTVTGLSEVDPAMIDAARGVGMDDHQRLRLVEFPLAMPVLVSGLRTSTVWGVGMATLSTPIGAPSLGHLIFSGLQTRNYTAVLVGCIAAAVLSQLLDRLVQGLEVGFSRRRPKLLWFSGCALAALALFALVSAVLTGSTQRSEPVRIGGKAFTEQYILGEILGQEVGVLGLPVEQTPSLGSSVVFDALDRGDIDLYVDYSGTIWTMVMGRKEIPTQRALVLKEVQTYLQRAHDITVVAALGYENTYALAMPEKLAAQHGITTISDLARVSQRMEIGGDFEFFERPEWRALQSTYGLVFAENRAMETALLYQAAEQGKVAVITAYSTDGRLSAFHMRVLIDDLGAIPPYDAILLASAQLSKRYPEVIRQLSRLEGKVSAKAMRELNDRVDLHEEAPETAAQTFRQTLPWVQGSRD